LPQVLENVRVERPRPDVVALLADEISAAEDELGPRGRVLVRPSGTEPLIRVMVEAESHGQAGAVAARLGAAVEALAGA
jgi:phosphoglucosamine mutase